MQNASSEPWIWTSGPVGFGDRKVLVACLVNPSDRDFHYGVAGFIDWYEKSWTRSATFASGLDFWDSLGRIASPGERLFVQMIGLRRLAGRRGSG
jgi:hypothetical protein